MSDYRRWRVDGGTFFFTVVTHHRRRFLTSDIYRDALREAFRDVRRLRPFSVVAIVLLPDHLHTIWELPPGDTDYTTRWRQIKTLFTRAVEGRIDGTVSSTSRRRRAEKGIWQRRFYEHTCRDEADVKRLADYIHVNPVKHRLSARVRDWPWSSFHRYVRLGEYAIDWGGGDLWYGDEFQPTGMIGACKHAPYCLWAVGIQRVAPGVGFQSWTTPTAVTVLPDGFGYLQFQ